MMFLRCKNSLSTFPLAVHDGGTSCSERISVCVDDAVCNKYLIPVLQACMPQQCDSCQQVLQQFYASMPSNVAELLAMCECEASDQSCLEMKTLLHSGTCGEHTWICQDTVNQCVQDSHCRYVAVLYLSTALL